VRCCKYEKRREIGQRSVTFFWVLIGLFRVIHQEHKKSADSHQAADSSVEISRSRDRSPAHRPLSVKAPCRLQGRLPDSVYRISPDAKYTARSAQVVCQI
jgi:hypothetical protein